jgi:hypothetical protein
MGCPVPSVWLSGLSRRDVVAESRYAAQQSLGLQQPERLRRCQPGHSVLLHECRDGRHRLTGLQFAALDTTPDVYGDLYVSTWVVHICHMRTIADRDQA